MLKENPEKLNTTKKLYLTTMAEATSSLNRAIKSFNHPPPGLSQSANKNTQAEANHHQEGTLEEQGNKRWECRQK